MDRFTIGIENGYNILYEKLFQYFNTIKTITVYEKYVDEITMGLRLLYTLAIIEEDENLE